MRILSEESSRVTNELLDLACFHTPVTCEGVDSDSEGLGWGLGALVSHTHTHPAVDSIAKP